MVRKRREQIVDTTELLNNAEIHATKINETFLDNALLTKETTITFLAQYKIVPNRFTCCNCVNAPMALIKNKSYIDGYCWSCITPCRYKHSIRKNSFLDGSKLHGRKLVKLLYRYLKNEELGDVAYEIDINRATVAKWVELLRECIAFYLLEHSEILGGIDENGRGKIVEMDESLFFRRKYNRGRLGDQQWYIGAIERGTRKICIIPVNNRNAETITTIIRENILPGTLIITDKWRAYNAALQNLDVYEHESVNHSLYFVDPNNSEVHTQNIEGLWSISKYFLRKKNGISREQQSKLLIQFMWQYNVEKFKKFNEVLILLDCEFAD